MNPRILLAEDHQDTSELVALMLLESGYEVETAATIRATLKLARDRNFNLFIFDSMLPDGSGIDLCRQVRTFDLQTPILFYSALAYVKDKDARRALEHGPILLSQSRSRNYWKPFAS